MEMRDMQANLPLQQTGRRWRAQPRRASAGGRLLSGRGVRRAGQALRMSVLLLLIGLGWPTACMSLELRAWGGTLSPASPSWDAVSLIRVEPDGAAVLDVQGQQFRAVAGHGVAGITGLSVVTTDYASQSAKLHFKGCELPSEQSL